MNHNTVESGWALSGSPSETCRNGEMAQRIAEFDWSATPLGPRSAWPPSLLAAVRLLLASPSPLVILWGREGTMIYNDAYAIFAGGRHPFLLGKPVEVGWPEVASFNRQVVETCLAGGTLTYRDKQLVLYRQGKPEDVWMDLSYSPVFDDDGQPAGVIAIVFETTAKVVAETQRQQAEDALMQLTLTLEQRVAAEVAARVAMEAQLRQAQKLEAIGSLTGGVAHDFNNVLQVIAANLQLIQLMTAGHAELEKRVAVASNAVSRGAKLASQLLAFARRQPLVPMVLNPLRLVEGMVEMLRRTLPASIDLSIEDAHAGWHIRADRNELESALLNLVINARDAIEGQGRIHIAVAAIDAAADRRAIDANVPAGEYVRLSVTDDGKGMPERVKLRAFEPFFTTKAEGQGTGLGLSMVHGFVSQSAGCVHISSAEGEGTTVDLYFPRCVDAECEPDQPVIAGDTRGGETILVVEDNADVRLATIEMLVRLGYKVLSAQDGDAALRLIQSGQRFDLLFTDVVMPGVVRSSELARIASGPPYNARVLFTSGYTRDVIFHDGKLDDGVALLSKPYRMDDLALAVRNALDRSPAARRT
ncbi:response regulator [Burkholderia dolosa]|uniref:histidine kinase n=1 Tax=Burkholderia dolosa TaxID=152500 RepID=A0A892I468_9BURK|nr:MULTISPECIES: ATP-binding protein [Burkholderia]AKE06016.1 histidine kinase [Burkholderia cepacia]AJY10703.1 response regulator [Burkholderia dolosa AU0158]AYZ93651.1 response regulator [Burkholderia dolosa]EAY70627.1 Signal transduction histidine kinase [Burkholderia dolosa AU0158]ETP62628.1 sensor histidine kinase [Burkholderia dolosa PC543]